MVASVRCEVQHMFLSAVWLWVLRQTITYHLHAIPLLTYCCAFDVMGVPAVITITVVGGGAVHGVEVSKEST